MRSLVVLRRAKRQSRAVELDEIAYAAAQFPHCFRWVQIDVFLLDGAPETLYPDVVLAASSAVPIMMKRCS